jgi:SAM-dependent methyltransferase
MFAELEGINRRPEPFSCLTIQELWADPHISEQMLRYHLDPSVDAASRSADFTDRSVAWISARFGIGPGRRVVDLGCGPGLYTGRLARTGAAVTGVDFSPRSIAYAREDAVRAGLPVSFVLADYLAWTPDDRFELALMIYCDYGAMAPPQRRRLLDRLRRILEPGGAFLFDVSSLAALADLEESVAYAPNLMDGFWSSQPYYGFLNTFTYADARASVDRYQIVEPGRTRTFCNWVQYFDPEGLASELGDAGFSVLEVLGDVAGAPYDPGSHEFAVVASPIVSRE